MLNSFKNCSLIILMSLLSRCHKHIPNPSWAVQYFSGNSRQPFSVLSASFNATSPFGCREHICLTRFQPAPWWGLSPQSPLSSVASLLHVPVLWLNDIGLSSDLGSLSHGTNTILRPMRQADVLGYSSGFQTWCLSELREALSKHRLRALTTEYSHLESVGPKNSHFFFFYHFPAGTMLWPLPTLTTTHALSWVLLQCGLQTAGAASPASWFLEC